MVEGGKILSKILKELVAVVKPDMTTSDFDTLAREFMKRENVEPSFPTVDNYPAALCTSLNDEAVHAIPSDRVIKNGDLLKLDVGIIHKGLHTDMATTVIVGGRKFFNKEYKQKRKLLSTTEAALEAGINMARVGNTIGDIGQAIQEVVEENGFTIVRELGGHGIGRTLHENPFLPNYRDGNYNDELVLGMALAIEPITSLGSGKISESVDGKGYRIKDGSLSAHFEHTIIITEKEPIIVTE